MAMCDVRAAVLIDAAKIHSRSDRPSSQATHLASTSSLPHFVLWHDHGISGRSRAAAGRQVEGRVVHRTPLLARSSGHDWASTCSASDKGAVAERSRRMAGLVGKVFVRVVTEEFGVAKPVVSRNVSAPTQAAGVAPLNQRDSHHVLDLRNATAQGRAADVSNLPGELFAPHRRMEIPRRAVFGTVPAAEQSPLRLLPAGKDARPPR
jgi:hypothetical protein